jgi:hypothetical protein
MEITVKIIKENKDGSADAEVNFDQEGWETLVQWGLVAMIKEGINTYATDEQRAKLVPVIKKKKKKKEVELDMDGRC